MNTIKYKGWRHAAAHFNRLRFEWSVSRHENFSIKFEVGGGENNRDISMHFGIPFLATGHLRIKDAHPFGWKNRQFKICYFESNFRIDPWSTVMEWNSTDPWWTRGVSFEMPWSWYHLRHEILDEDRDAVLSTKYPNFWERWILKRRSPDFFENWKPKERASTLVSKTFDFTYTLKSGEIQKRLATCHLERRTWCWRWIPWIKMHRTSMDVVFNEEVGEESGSWKGGCVGCSYDILPEETMEQCLRRMEKERKF